MMRFQPSGVATAVALLAALAAQGAAAQADVASSSPSSSPSGQPAESAEALPTVTVRASADASAQGLSPAYAGGQVARGGRAGILGTRDSMDTPFSITAYTNELIQDRQARSVGDVLQNDPTVRVARGFGNFQEAYFIRGFALASDDVAYNGLYNLLPRQYIATELVERVEVLRGASAFLNGANPGGTGIGGAINLLPKRAPNEPLNRLTFSLDGNGGTRTVSADIARRFGPDQSTGVRVNAALRNGDTSVDDESAKLGLVAVGLDWRGRDARWSADIGHQDHKLRRTRTNLTLGTAVTAMPSIPDNDSNWAQDWSYSYERDVFGTLRGEYDFSADVTGWIAYGMREGQESNSLANVTVTNAATGAGTFARFDNVREERVDTGELGLRGKLRTGPVKHEWVASWSTFTQKRNNAYGDMNGATQATNIYAPLYPSRPTLARTFNDLSDPALQYKIRFTSVALGDTLSMLDDKLLLTLGVRHQQLSNATYAYGLGANGTGAKTGAYDKSETSPLAGIVYKLDRQWSVYGNYVEGLVAGDVVSSTVTPAYANAGEMLAPYVSRQKEIGLKYDSGRVRGGLAVFHTSKPRTFRNASNELAAEGQDVHQGVELTVQGVATKGLRLLGGGTWLDAKQDNTGAANTTGKRVIGIPQFQATLGAEWDVPGVRGLALDGRVIHTGSRYANAINTFKAPGWTRLDVGARYITDIQGRAVTWRARIDNLTDRDYWASVGGSGSPTAGYLVVGAPRTLGVSASVDF